MVLILFTVDFSGGTWEGYPSAFLIHPLKSGTMNNNLSYYRLSLISLLKESHPELLNDKHLIDARSESALETYANAIKNGYRHYQAGELATQILYQGLHFSKHSTLLNIIWNEFVEEVPEEQAKELAIKLLPSCEAVFDKYFITDDFADSFEFDQLYTELTGAIVIYLENDELQ